MLRIAPRTVTCTRKKAKAPLPRRRPPGSQTPCSSALLVSCLFLGWLREPRLLQPARLSQRSVPLTCLSAPDAQTKGDANSHATRREDPFLEIRLPEVDKISQSPRPHDFASRRTVRAYVVARQPSAAPQIRGFLAAALGQWRSSCWQVKGKPLQGDSYTPPLVGDD